MKLIRFLLFPFAMVYDLVTTFRNTLYTIGFFKHFTFSKPIIVVGNLSVGGTGKTPQIEYLIRVLKDRYNIAVLSRGYKRKTNGFIQVNTSHSADEVGDEPLQFFKKFTDIIVAVDANRAAGIEKITQQNPVDVILLDDGFQHRKVKGSFYILLTKFDDLFINDYLLPTGNLRENKSGAKRANAIIVTKCPENSTENQRNEIQKKIMKFTNHVFFTKISYAKNVIGKDLILVDELKKYEILLITGIANPKLLLEFLNKKLIHFHHINFPDHHHFSESDIEMIQSKFANIKSDKKLILTTEKDFVRLQKIIENCYYLPIETQFIGHQNIKFDDLIVSHIDTFC